MARRLGRWALVCAVAMSVAAAWGGEVEALRPFVGDAALAKIEAAAPAKASAEPAKPRKVLVFTEAAPDLARAQKNKGMKFVPHVSAPHCALAVAAVGRKTGAFEATVTSDPKVFSAQGLAGFDAIILANVYLEDKLYKVARDLKENQKPMFAARQKAVLDFVRGGKGLVGVHNATCPALGWPEFNAMVGGTHHGHAWYAHQEVPVKLDDPQSPLCAAFGGKGFAIRDDVYVLAEPYSRKAVHVLMSVDAAKAPESMTADRADGDYPLAWVRDYGGGRVFYTALGDAPETFQGAAFLRHLLDGIQFALGDLKAPTSPGTPLPAKAGFAVMPEGWTALFDGKDLSAWNADQRQAESWKVEDGIIRYDGKAGTLRTKKDFRNYTLRVDWRLPREADSGVFVRGNQQLNIWTWSMGSGEMWGPRQRWKPKAEGEKNPYTPKACADRAVGEWNTFVITCLDDKITVVLNGVEVITEAPLVGLKPRSPLSLQRHGDPLEYKSIYVKELPGDE